MPEELRDRIENQILLPSCVLGAKGATVIRPTKVYFVRLDVIAIPDWALLKAVPELSINRADASLWLRSHALARLLCKQDRAEGGKPMLMPVEFRRCPSCRRLIIGYEAAEQRVRLEEYTGSLKTCDSKCVERQKHLKGNAA